MSAYAESQIAQIAELRLQLATAQQGIRLLASVEQLDAPGDGIATVHLEKGVEHTKVPGGKNARATYSDAQVQEIIAERDRLREWAHDVQAALAGALKHVSPRGKPSTKTERS